MSKTLIKYFRKPDCYKAVIVHKMFGPSARLEFVKGEKRGVIVAIGAGKVGWSLCDKLDKFDKTVGLEKAIERAEFLITASDTERALYFANVPRSMTSDVEEMVKRSFDYFK